MSSAPGAEAPFAHRFKLYLDERFPVAVNLTLFAALTLAIQAAAQATDGGRLLVSWRTGVVFLTLTLITLHLRLMDESKDYEEDKIAHPERLVSRGVITLAELNRVAAIVIGIEVLLAFLLGWH